MSRNERDKLSRKISGAERKEWSIVWSVNGGTEELIVQS